MYKKKCENCGKDIITTQDHFAEVSTYNRYNSLKQKLPDDHVYFHFQCWVDYFNSKVEQKMANALNRMKDQAMSILNTPYLKNILDKIPDLDIPLSMVINPVKKNYPAEKPDELRDIVIKKIKNGRARARTKDGDRKKRSINSGNTPNKPKKESKKNKM